MKNICLYVWGLLMLLVSCTPSQPKDYYEIVGEVKNVADSTIINLFRIEGSMGKTIAVDTIIGGKFYFKIKPDSLAKDELNLACFRSREFPTMACKLWASAGDIVKVTGENALIHTWKVKGGAPENASMQAYLDDSRPLWDEYQLNAIRQKNMSTRGRDLSEEEYQMWKKERDSLESVNKELSLRIAANVISRMKKNKVDKVWLNELSGKAGSVKHTKNYPYKEEVIELYNSLTEEQKQHPLAQEACANLFPPQHIEVGKEAADATLYDLDGKKHSLSELRGKYVLIDFWSTGCGPCIMAIPEMGEIVSAYKDKLSVVSISIDTKRVWGEASKEHPMTWNNWNDLKEQAGIYAHYDLGGIPNYTLVSPEGMVVEQWSGYGKGSLKRKMEQYIK